MNVGITGASGFIGRHLVDAFSCGHTVHAFAHHRAVAGVPCTHIDLMRPDTLALGGMDAIVHAGAYVPASYTDPEEAHRCLEVNAFGTLAMLRAAERAGVRRFVLLSGNLYRFSTEPVTEDAPIDPSDRATYYLASKAYADTVAEHFRKQGRLEVVILRPSAVYGPGLVRGMMATFLERLERRDHVTIDDGGRYRVDLVYVGDVAAAAVAAVERMASGPYNLGAGETTSPLTIARLLCQLVGAPPSLIDVLPARDSTLLGFPPLANARARKDLGFAPRSLDDGVASYLRWWRSER